MWSFFPIEWDIKHNWHFSPAVAITIFSHHIDKKKRPRLCSHTPTYTLTY